MPDSKNPSSSKNSATLAMVEAAFLASTKGMLFLVNYYFPMGPFLRMFFPTPTALAYLRWGKRAAWMTTTVSFLLLSVLMGPTRSIQFLIPHGLQGIMLGYLWRRRSPWSVSIFLGTILGSLGALFQLVFVSFLLGENVWVYITVQLTNFVAWVMQSVGSIDLPDLWLVQVLAAIGIVFSNVMYQFLVHLVAWLLLDRLGNPISPAPKWLQALLD